MSVVGAWRCLALAVWLGQGVLAGAVAQPRVDWVALVQGKAQAPDGIRQGGTLAVRIESARQGPWTLRVRMFPVGGAAMSDKVILRPAEWRARATGSVPTLLIPLPSVDWRLAIQLEAALVDDSGRSVGEPAVLTLDRAAAAAGAPASFSQVLGRGGALLDRLTTLFDVVRQGPGKPRIYSVSVNAEGNPIQPSRQHELPEGRVLQLAASPDSAGAAWAVELDGKVVIWLSQPDGAVRALWSGNAPVAGPAFVDGSTLVFATSEGLMVASTVERPVIETHALPPGRVGALHFAEARGGVTRAYVTMSSPGGGAAAPFVLTLAAGRGPVTATRVPESPFYAAYGAITDVGVLYLTGSEAGVEGIHALGPNDTALRTVLRCAAPRFVAASARGRQLHVVADTCDL